MTKPEITDLLHVRIYDLDERLFRQFCLPIRAEVTLPGSRWLPGVVTGPEEDLDVQEICSIVNEGGFPRDEDWVTTALHGELGKGRNLFWTAERIPIATQSPKPPDSK